MNFKFGRLKDISHSHSQIYIIWLAQNYIIYSSFQFSHSVIQVSDNKQYTAWEVQQVVLTTIIKGSPRADTVTVALQLQLINMPFSLQWAE